MDRFEEIKVAPDRDHLDNWRVEAFDEDGACYITIFVGPLAEERAQDYAAYLRSGKD